MRVLSFSETGCVRKNNEDSYLVLSEYGLYAVADGMGGHLAGEIAARIALNQLENLAPELPGVETTGLEDWLRGALAEANRVVFESSARHPETEGMGTTLTVLLKHGQEGVIANVGDSRAYRWRRQQLTRLTDDHSLVEELLRLGQISPEEAENHPRRNVLTRAIGAAEETKADCFKLDLEQDDVFLLCTDGFSNVVSDEEISQEFRQPGTWEGHMAALRQLILDRGAPDNFTALCCILE